MKSRIIIPASEKLLLYGENAVRTEKILSGERVSCIVVAKDAAGETLAYLSGESGASRCGKSESRDDECMVFCGFSGERLNHILGILRVAGVCLPYKAVMTPSNRLWTLCALIDELKREHESMK